MKHLKLFENKNAAIFILEINYMFEVEYCGFDDYLQVFYTKQDAENWLINMCNDTQDAILSGDFKIEQKDKFKKFELENFKKCEDFIYKLTEEFGNHHDIITYIRLSEDIIQSEEIRDDVKMKISTNKYNL